MIHTLINLGDFIVYFNCNPDPYGTKHTMQQKFFPNRDIGLMEAFFAAQDTKTGPVIAMKCIHKSVKNEITWENYKMKTPQLPNNYMQTGE